MSPLWLVPASGLILLWAGVLVLEAGGHHPEGPAVRALWIVSMPLKAATLLTLVWLAHRAAAALNAHPGRRGPFLLRWCGAVLLLALAGWAVRDPLAVHLIRIPLSFCAPVPPGLPGVRGAASGSSAKTRAFGPNTGQAWWHREIRSRAR